MYFRILSRLLLVVTIGLAADSSLAAQAAAGKAATAPVSAIMLLGQRNRELLKRAFKAADRKRWRHAYQLVDGLANPLPGKVIRWLHFTRAGSKPSFAALASFLQSNPKWPRRSRLLAKAEAAMDNRMSDALVLTWFANYPPVSPDGRLRLAETLLRQHKVGAAAKWLRQIWINDNLSRKKTRAFYTRHKGYLRRQDHQARLDRLLWDGKRGPAHRMLSILPRSQRLLARARMSLMSRSANVNVRIANVPLSLRGDPGLIYERVRWRRRNKKHESAQVLLLKTPGDPGPRPKRWWTERRIQARKLLKAGDPDKAYRITAGHGQPAGTLAHAEAEWLAGWIAFRFLNDKSGAATHFRQLHEAVKTPLSRARASYWRARVASEMGRANHAVRWYREAAGYPTTYYGQLAIENLKRNPHMRLPRTPVPGVEVRAGFGRRELVQAAELLGEFKQWKTFRSFILHLAGQAKRPVERIMLSGIASRFGRYELGVRVAKNAVRSGQQMIDYGYPLFKLPKSSIEAALTFAIIRQESEFKADAISPAGARGLMQLMPATARELSRRLKLRYSRARLLSDPNYNVRLGNAYVAQMLKAYNGSYPLAIAAYNAGPGRVNEWLREFGNPSDGGIDAIDWVEKIPFRETRNYVQRVLDGLQVYRQRLADKPLKSRLSADLTRTTRVQ